MVVMRMALLSLALVAGAARAEESKPTVADVLAWDGLPELMLGVATDTADRAVTLTGADVTEVKPEEDDSTVENGITVYFIDLPHWCGPVAKLGTYCWGDRRECLRKARSCKATANVACVGVEARTDGEQSSVCRPSYGECERTRRLLDLTDEYALSECMVTRQRKAKR